MFLGVSLIQFLRTELTRGYHLEQDEERFSAQREKIYSFMKIPREVEKFMFYGFFQVNKIYFFINLLRFTKYYNDFQFHCSLIKIFLIIVKQNFKLNELTF